MPSKPMIKHLTTLFVSPNLAARATEIATDYVI